MKPLVYLTDVVTLQLDPALCNGCRMCTVVCPHNVFAMVDKKARIINLDLCMECGACEKNCPTNAINVSPGVGCAAGIITGYINKTEPTCGCSSEKSACC